MSSRLQQYLASRDINEAYEIGKVLGKGAYSVVKSATGKKTGEEVRRTTQCSAVHCPHQ